ncbi:KNR4-like protein-3 [Pasteurella multocida]|nr:KNR4-like protein-3 [Pasteurella multocida]
MVMNMCILLVAVDVATLFVFDYRDDPKGSEPKICLVIHDEYDEETGKHLLFPVAENF